MELGSPLDAVATAINHAAHVAFPDIHYKTRDWEAVGSIALDERKNMSMDDYPMMDKTRRPRIKEIEVVAMFPQLWGSTALGFGGIGGAAMTRAYTVVVRLSDASGSSIGVYWGGKHAYTLHDASMTPQQIEHFTNDIKENQTESVRDAALRYGAPAKKAW